MRLCHSVSDFEWYHVDWAMHDMHDWRDDSKSSRSKGFNQVDKSYQ